MVIPVGEDDNYHFVDFVIAHTSGTQAVASSSAPYAQPGAQSAPMLQPHQHQGYGPGPQHCQVDGWRGQRRGGRNSGCRRRPQVSGSRFVEFDVLNRYTTHVRVPGGV